MKTKKFFSLLFILVFALSLTVLAACGNNSDATQDDTTTEQKDTTAANGTEDTNEPNSDSTTNTNTNENIKVTVTSPEEDSEVSGGKATVSGSVEGDVTEIKITMVLDDESVIGEGKALVADVSHEFPTDINYTIPEGQAGDEAMDCKIKLTCMGKDGKEVKDALIHVSIKP